MSHENAYELGPAAPDPVKPTTERTTEHFSLEPPITRESVMHALEVCVADKGIISIHVEGGVVTVNRVVSTNTPAVPGPEPSGLTEESVEHVLGSIQLEELPPTGEPLHDLMRAGKRLSELGLLPRYLLLAAGDFYAHAVIALNSNKVLGVDVFPTNSLSAGSGVLLGTPTYRCDIISAEHGIRITVDEPIKEIGEN